MTTTNPDRNKIEDRLSDLLGDPWFRKIDARFRQFNLFEAVGAVRSELRHSNFLAYLLSPSRPHGLGAEVLGRLLRAIISTIQPDKRPISLLRVIAGDLESAVVGRERDNIDILIEMRAIRLVLVIENKVGAAVTEGQLAGYKNVVLQKYHDWKHLFVLLNPDGSRPVGPTYDDPDYFTFSYEEFALLLDKYVEEQRQTLSSDLILILSNYVGALRRHVVEDTELTEMARQLYARHKEAFDFVFKIRPERDDLLEPLRALIEQNASLCLDKPGPGVIRFAHKDWTHHELNSCPPEQWTKSKRNLLFELRAYRDSPRISVSLILGPGEDSLRNHIYSEASRRPAVFIGLVKPMGQRTSTIYVRDLRPSRASDGLDDTERGKALESSWRDFLERDLLSLNSAVKEVVDAYSVLTSQTIGNSLQ